MVAVRLLSWSPCWLPSSLQHSHRPNRPSPGTYVGGLDNGLRCGWAGGPAWVSYIHGFCCCFPATSLFLAAFKDCWAGPGCELIKNKGAALRLHTAHCTATRLPEGCRQLLSLKLMGTCITALTQSGVVGVTASCCCKVIHVVTASHVGQRAGSDAPSCASCGLSNACM